MKPWPIKLVEQKGKTCTIACLAMVHGASFDFVLKHFSWPEEMKLMNVADYLGSHGYSVLIKEVIFHNDPTFARAVISQPFAPVHIVHVKQFSDDPIQHVVVMDQHGKIFDPAGAKFNLDDYYMLTGVLGIWRPIDL